jgi:1,2-diacylglycerol 3-alpha-glucosyltransferase
MRDGVVTSILLTKKELEKLGHEVFIFAPAPKSDADREEGVRYFRSVAFRGYRGYRVPLFPTNKSEILEELGIDIIHNHGLAFNALRSMFAGRTLKRPVVTTWHTNATEAVKYYNVWGLPEDVSVNLMWIYIKRLLRRSEAVIAPTTAIKNELTSNVSRLRRVEVIPTGVDLGRFRTDLDSSLLRERYGLEGKRVVLHLGRIAMEKNLDLILNGFAKLAPRHPDLVLMVAGDGPARGHYQELSKMLGISDRTVFTGFIKDEELPLHYALCDVFTIASKFETQGLVVLEAMACGRPVVGIDFRAVAEIIRNDKDGFLFQGTKESWCDAMERALAAPPWIGQMARARSEQYSQSEGARKLVDLYRDAFASKQTRVGGKERLEP